MTKLAKIRPHARAFAQTFCEIFFALGTTEEASRRRVEAARAGAPIGLQSNEPSSVELDLLLLAMLRQPQRRR